MAKVLYCAAFILLFAASSHGFNRARCLQELTKAAGEGTSCMYMDEVRKVVNNLVSRITAWGNLIQTANEELSQMSYTRISAGAAEEYFLKMYDILYDSSTTHVELPQNHATDPERFDSKFGREVKMVFKLDTVLENYCEKLNKQTLFEFSDLLREISLASALDKVEVSVHSFNYFFASTANTVKYRLAAYLKIRSPDGITQQKFRRRTRDKRRPPVTINSKDEMKASVIDLFENSVRWEVSSSSVEDIATTDRTIRSLYLDPETKAYMCPRKHSKTTDPSQSKANDKEQAKTEVDEKVGYLKKLHDAIVWYPEPAKDSLVSPALKSVLKVQPELITYFACSGSIIGRSISTAMKTRSKTWAEEGIADIPYDFTDPIILGTFKKYARFLRVASYYVSVQEDFHRGWLNNCFTTLFKLQC